MYEDHLAALGGISSKLNEAGTNHLNCYVYALIDPRDQKIFYVGEGVGDRVTAHFREAIDAQTRPEGHDAKTRRIIEIIEAGSDIDAMFSILARRLSKKKAEVVEASIMAALGISQNGPLLNQQAGKHSAEHGSVTLNDIASLVSQPVQPTKVYSTLVFPIQKALSEGRTAESALSCCWSIKHATREKSGLVAIGVENGISKIARSITGYIERDSGRVELILGSAEIDELVNVRLTHVINAAFGYWQRGSYLGVEFNGKDEFRIVRGSSHKEWQPLGR